MKPQVYAQVEKDTVTLRYYHNGVNPPAPEVSLSIPLDGGEHKQEILEFRFTDGERWNGTFAELQNALKVAKGMKDLEESTPWAGLVEGLLTDERRQDMLVGALEGGSNYWYEFREQAMLIIDRGWDGRNKTFVDRLWMALSAGFDIPVHDVENGDEIGSISKTRIIEGEKLMREKHPEHWANIINKNDDAETADVWFQMVVLKELVYG